MMPDSKSSESLFVSEKTVRNSLTRVFERLGVRTRTQAAVLARDWQFLPAKEMTGDRRSNRAVQEDTTRCLSPAAHVAISMCSTQ